MEGVADYRFVEPLGSGPGGTAYLAEPPARLRLGEPCVVRVLDRGVSSDEFGRLVAELRVVAALRGERLVELLEVGEEGGRLFIASRHYPEGSLATATAVPESVRLRALADAARGLHALHEYGIVHRGLRPGAVLLAGGRGRLGVPSLVELAAPGVTSTAGGPLEGLAYLEPEVIWGEPAGRATDIWALGVTAHEALCARSVHPELPTDDVAAAFQHVLHVRPLVDPAVGPAAAEIIERCLASRRVDRYATALDAARAFEHLAGAAPETATGTEVALPPATRLVALADPDPTVLVARRPLPVEGSVEIDEEGGPPEGEVVVRGVRCARAHLNPPGALTCARCGIRLATGGEALVEGVRPPLGVLTLDDGQAVPLARDVVLGREPTVDALVEAGTAAGVRVDDPGRTVSRAHALVQLVGWDVVLEDRGSANGTFVRVGPSHPWHRLAPGERHGLRPGTTIRLGERELTFEQYGVL